jgi:gluconate 2-dehydrogenase gamma chain
VTLDPVSRRGFLGAVSAGVGGSWMAARWPSIAAAAEHAARAVAAPDTANFQSLLPGEAVEIEAMAARILPSDDGPGARETGAVHFIDRALATFARDHGPMVATGLANLGTVVATSHPGGGRFSALAPGEQDEVLRTIEGSDFFQFVRWGTVAGFLANPSYDGNRDEAGWRWIGFDDRFVWQPPFGYYDREDVVGR